MEQNSAKFSFNFEKKTINKTVTSFMEKSVLTEDQKNCVSQMAQGKKLKKGDHQPRCGHPNQPKPKQPKPKQQGRRQPKGTKL